MDWFRSFHGAPVDPTWRLIAKKAGVRTGDVALVWWGLMDYASQQKDRGSVQGFDPEVYAAAWDIEEDVIRKVLGALEEKGKIHDDKITAWEKRNPKREDDSSDRVKRFREKNNAAKRDVTRGNAREEESREEEKDISAHAVVADQSEAEAIKAFNDLAGELAWPKCEKVSATRKSKLRARLRDCGGIDGWYAALARAKASKFLRGETGRGAGHENWRPDIDFFLTESKFLKLIEGGFDGSTAAPAVTTNPTKALADEEWRSALRRFQTDHKWPAVGYGPQPGYGGCVVPTQILAEFNLESRAA